MFDCDFDGLKTYLWSNLLMSVKEHTSVIVYKQTHLKLNTEESWMKSKESMESNQLVCSERCFWKYNLLLHHEVIFLVNNVYLRKKDDSLIIYSEAKLVFTRTNTNRKLKLNKVFPRRLTIDESNRQPKVTNEVRK